MTTLVPGALDERAPEPSTPPPVPIPSEPSIPAEPSPPSMSGGSHWWIRSGRPAWSVPARGAIFVSTLVLYTWNLSAVGMSNTFYAAAVKSGTVSWKAFFFGSLDPGNFITVDKPPAALWVEELSGRVFGFSSWSMLLPEALAGVACVMIVYRLVRRWAGETAAVFGAVALAVTPIATEMFRDNNPDAMLTLFLVAAAWALWSALETAKTNRLVLCATLIGFAFLTKTLEAFIVLPAFGLVYLVCAKPRLPRRLAQLGWAALALVISSGWWVAIVELWPAASRPYIGGSTDNSEWNLIFGYNGFSRITGSGGGAGGPGGGGPGFAGNPGVLRMFNDLIGGQISWLLPLAVVGLVGGLWFTRKKPRDSLRRAGYVLWGGWTLMFAAVFSDAQGIFHPYYTVVLAPGVAALSGAGALALWRLGRSSRWWCWVLPAAVIGSAVWAAVLLGRTPGYDSWLEPAIVAAGVVAAACLLLSVIGAVRARMVAAAAAGIGAASVLAGPVAYSFTTVNNAAGGTLASAGPSTGAGGLGGGLGGAGRFPGGAGAAGGAAARLRAGAGAALPQGTKGLGTDASANQALVSYLEKHQGSAEYLVAVTGSQTAAPIILATGKPVIAMGGFNGGDPAPTLAQFKTLVATGKVHYVVVGGGTGAGAALPGALSGGDFPGGFPGGARGSFPRPPGAGSGANGFPSGGAAGGFPGGAGGGGAPAGPGGRSSTVSAIDTWVTSHGTKVSYGSTGGGTLYYLTSAAAT
ncbi:MAG TPA: glycosyltransferase family 39 protein [Acidimicrobiales bacterium]